MTSRKTYRVTARPGTGHWVFQCSEYPRAVSRGISLADAYDVMPEAIAIAAGLPAASVAVNLVPDCTVVALDDAQVSLPELAAESADHEIYLTRNHQVVAVLLGAHTYEQMMEDIKELEESIVRARSDQGDEGRTFTPAVYDS